MNSQLNSNLSNNFTSGNLMPPLPPRRSASATPTDSPLISPRHSSHQKPNRTHSTRNAQLDLDSRISEQSATFVKKPINYHSNNKNFPLSNSIFNSQSGAESLVAGGFLQDEEPSGKRNVSNTGSFLNSSLSNLLDGELDGRPSQSKATSRILKTSKSSLVFTNNFSPNRKDDLERPNEDCLLTNLLTNVKAHELLESKQSAFPDQHGKRLNEKFFFVC